MGKKAKMARTILAPPESTIKEQPNGPTSTRCRAKHDVPYTLRCTLLADGHRTHKDKDGREW